MALTVAPNVRPRVAGGARQALGLRLLGRDARAALAQSTSRLAWRCDAPCATRRAPCSKHFVVSHHLRTRPAERGTPVRCAVGGCRGGAIPNLTLHPPQWTAEVAPSTEWPRVWQSPSPQPQPQPQPEREPGDAMHRWPPGVAESRLQLKEENRRELRHAMAGFACCQRWRVCEVAPAGSA